MAAWTFGIFWDLCNFFYSFSMLCDGTFGLLSRDWAWKKVTYHPDDPLKGMSSFLSNIFQTVQRWLCAVLSNLGVLYSPNCFSQAKKDEKKTEKEKKKRRQKKKERKVPCPKRSSPGAFPSPPPPLASPCSSWKPSFGLSWKKRCPTLVHSFWDISFIPFFRCDSIS